MSQRLFPTLPPQALAHSPASRPFSPRHCPATPVLARAGGGSWRREPAVRSERMSVGAAAVIRAAWVMVAFGVGCVANLCGVAVAQDPWEYKPYRIHVWLALEAVPELPAALGADLERAVIEQSDAAFGATWDVQVRRAPARYLTELLYRDAPLPPDELAAAAKLGKQTPAKAADKPASSGGGAAAPSAAGAPASDTTSAEAKKQAAAAAEAALARDPLVAELRAVFKSDKLLVASVTAAAGGWRVRARELDVRARRWTAVWEAEAPDVATVPSVVVAGLHASFLPVVRIDYAQDKTIMTRLRAGALAVRGDEPVVVGEDSLLRPWVRHNDRYGEPRPPLGVQPIPFSFLMVKKRDVSRLECEPHTGVRFPITGRNSARTERFALAVRATGESTMVRLRTNEKPPQPLSGYDVFAKDPKSEKVELIGRTDWRGTMELPKQADSPLRVVYVKNGGSLLARLPTVPGHEAEMVVDLTPDDKRLQAEGFVAGVQAVLTDLVAQRELYAKRIRSRLSEGKINEAQKLLEEFKALPTRDDVQKLLDQQQPRITTSYKKVQAKIDKLFEDTRKLLYKFVDPAMGAKLEEEVRLTSEGKGPYAAALGAVGAAERAVAPGTSGK